MKNRHPRYSKFEAFLKEKGITLKDIAETINTSVATVCNKNKGKSDYTMQEINHICDEYDLSSEIFRQ